MLGLANMSGTWDPCELAPKCKCDSLGKAPYTKTLYLIFTNVETQFPRVNLEGLNPM